MKKGKATRASDRQAGLPAGPQSIPSGIGQSKTPAREKGIHPEDVERDKDLQKDKTIHNQVIKEKRNDK